MDSSRWVTNSSHMGRSRDSMHNSRDTMGEEEVTKVVDIREGDEMEGVVVLWLVDWRDCWRLVVAWICVCSAKLLMVAMEIREWKHSTTNGS